MGCFSHYAGHPASRIFSMENGRIVHDDSAMRFSLGMLLFGLLASGAMAQSVSAFAAVRTARKVSGGAAVAEISGVRGQPRPQEWTVVFSDPLARGGVREVVVSGDEIGSERTPLRGYAGVGALPPLVISRLNVDSDGAFGIANKQAREHQVGFHWADYTLRADNVTGVPVWVLTLHNHMGARVGVIHISAEDGSIVMPLEVADMPVGESGGGLEHSATGKRIGGVIGAVGGVVDRTANTVKDATLRTVGTVQEILTGERTIGPQENDD
jgi:hypothetical protein